MKTKLVGFGGWFAVSLAAACAGNGGRADVGANGAGDARADGVSDAGTGTVVLDPSGTYGDKTYTEWGVEWARWFNQQPGPEFSTYDSTGPRCVLWPSGGDDRGTSDSAPVLLVGANLTDISGGAFESVCTIPAGRMIFVPLVWFLAGTSIPGCISLGDQESRNWMEAMAQAVTGLSLDIDGKSYGSKVSDFARYLTKLAQFSYTIPDTPSNIVTLETGCQFTGPVTATGYIGGYWVLLAPLSPGSHRIHFTSQFAAVPSYGLPAFSQDETYNLTVADTSTLGIIDGGPSMDAPSAPDAAQPAHYCTGPASGALIDDMSGSSISLAPPPCASPGSWTVWSAGPGSGGLTTPTGDTSILSNCGSLCQSLYSPLPASLPGNRVSLDGGAVDSGAADGGASGMQAMCMAGQTSPSQYSWSGMTLTFAYSGVEPSGTGPRRISSPSLGSTTDPPPALIDASRYSGIELWLWASPDTAAAMTAGFAVELIDRKQLPGAGVCDPNATSGSSPCSGASAAVSFSTAAGSQGTGSLLDADGFELTALVPGWQLVRAPWSSFRSNPYYGGGNEKSVDPTTLAFVQFLVEQDAANGPAVPFDFCVYGLSFYK